MSFARGEGDGGAFGQIVRDSVNNHAGGAFEDDEQLVHVGMRVGDEDFARGDDDAGNLGEGRKFAFAEPDALLRCRIVTDWLFGSAVDAAEYCHSLGCPATVY